MAQRPSLDVELRPLLRALENRIGNLDEVRKERCDGYTAFSRGGVPFLHLEIRRDHMHLDLWLESEKLDEARASGIARPHPFLGDQAVRVRFERAEDLTRVARWLEASHQSAPERGSRDSNPPASAEPPASSPTPAAQATPKADAPGRASGASKPTGPGRARTRSPRDKASDGQKRAANKSGTRRKPTSR